MAEINDGGPAFPCGQTLDGCGMPRDAGWPGLSLRAYFAAHAPAVVICELDAQAKNEMDRTRFRAMHAVRYADALIAELQRERKG